jgi:hypothetical protein
MTQNSITYMALNTITYHALPLLGTFRYFQTSLKLFVLKTNCSVFARPLKANKRTFQKPYSIQNPNRTVATDPKPYTRTVQLANNRTFATDPKPYSSYRSRQNSQTLGKPNGSGLAAAGATGLLTRCYKASYNKSVGDVGNLSGGRALRGWGRVPCIGARRCWCNWHR